MSENSISFVLDVGGVTQVSPVGEVIKVLDEDSLRQLEIIYDKARMSPSAGLLTINSKYFL